MIQLAKLRIPGRWPPLRHYAFRVHVVARWAAALLAVGGVLSVVLSLMPDAFYRFLAVPNGIAMIGLGYSLWRLPERSTTKQPSAITIPARTAAG